jgi:hypothetical protein
VACIARLCNTNELYRLSPSPTCYSWRVGSKIPQGANGVVQSYVVVTQTKTNETDIKLTLLVSSRGASRRLTGKVPEDDNKAIDWYRIYG